MALVRVSVGLDLLADLFGAVGHVDDQLLVGGVGEEHDPLGVEVVALLAMYLR